jgi:hypothetical protein
MTEEQSLYIALVVLYILECTAYVPRGSAAFIRKAAGKALLRFPRRGVSNNRGGLVLGPLVPGAGTVFVVPQWPVALGEEGALGWVAESLELEERAHQTGAFVRFEEMPKPARADFRDVVAGGVTLASVSSSLFARRVAEGIESVRGAPKEKRAEAIDAIIAAHTDVEGARRRVDQVERETAALRWAGFAIAIVVFLVAPAAVMTLGLGRIWLPLLAGVFAVTWVGAALFFRAHRRLLPDERLERIGLLLLIGFMPISPLLAVRAVDAIARSALHGYHPLAVALAIAPPEQQRSFALHLLRDARWPRRPVCLSDDPAAQAVEESYREALRRGLMTIAEEASIPVAEATSPPAQEEGAKSYCPRCLSQLEQDIEACADCGGVPVKAFERLA